MGGYTGSSYNIIGRYMQGAYDEPFTGVFDGNDHTISNFTYACTDANHVGLFGYINDSNAEIKDLGLKDVNVDAGTGSTHFHVGAIAAWLESGRVSRCYVEGGSITGSREVGGLIGHNVGEISECYVAADVFGSGDVIGGLVGGNNGPISRCYAKGTVTGGEMTGGLTGINGAYWENPSLVGTVVECYSAAAVSGSGMHGGLIAFRDSGAVTDCFWDVNSSGMNVSDGGTGLESWEMRMESTFSGAGWDFTTPVWVICEGANYPRLVWEKLTPGDLACPEGVDIVDFSVLAGQWQLGGKLCSDIATDGVVDLLDWSVFSNAWMSSDGGANWDPDCDIAGGASAGVVDGEDVALFISQWLVRGNYIPDIAPAGGDGVFDEFDLAALAENWLSVE
jgi:hypothetical protein